MNKYRPFVMVVSGMVLLIACSTADHIARTARKELLDIPPFNTAHVGISIYDVSKGKSLYNYQGDKYFVPASNTKLFTLFAGLKFLKDSLAGLLYEETADTFFIYPTADPTLLHPDFPRQPVIQKLKDTEKQLVMVNNNWQEEALGYGWSWDDYNSSYMAERSALPVYGNVIKWIQVSQKNTQAELEDSMQTFVFSEPDVNWKVRFVEDTLNKSFMVKRKRDENYFQVSQGKETFREQFVPFVTNGILSAVELLRDTIGKEIVVQTGPRNTKRGTIYSQPADSLFKKMMYRSDNFYAEQTLLMASNERLGIMNDEKIIDTLLKSELSQLPQKPSWVDGSGLSRYNLFSPNDFVWILNKLKDEFGLERIKAILPAGGQGTLTNYFKEESGYIFAKTGTLTGHVALSGYLTTKKNKLMIFSVLVNNHHGSATAIRKGVETFLRDIRSKY